MIRLVAVWAFILYGVLANGCLETKKEGLDPDSDKSLAKLLPMNRSISDFLNSDENDRVDWKQIRPDKTGTLHLEMTWKQTDTIGYIRIYNGSGHLMKRYVTTDTLQIQFQTPVTPADQFYVKISIARGALIYSLKATIDEGAKVRFSKPPDFTRATLFALNTSIIGDIDAKRQKWTEVRYLDIRGQGVLSLNIIWSLVQSFTEINIYNGQFQKIDKYYSDEKGFTADISVYQPQKIYLELKTIDGRGDYEISARFLPRTLPPRGRSSNSAGKAKALDIKIAGLFARETGTVIKLKAGSLQGIKKDDYGYIIGIPRSFFNVQEVFDNKSFAFIKLNAAQLINAATVRINIATE